MAEHPVGVIGAMDEEIAQLLERMEEQDRQQKAGIVFYRGRLFGKSAVVCKSGVGKVNAAVCAQVLIDLFHVERIIFTGVAGALDPRLDIADIVVSEDCMYHDMDASAIGFDKGVIPFSGLSVFKADPGMVRKALEAGMDRNQGKVLKGRVLSGDQFIADRRKVEQLHAEFGGACTEMEGAAVAQVCVMNDIPFVVIRSMSDKADGSASANFAEFTVRASEQSLGIVEGIFKRL